MKKRICILIFLILLSQAILSPLLASDAAADTRITITFAAGGAACGLYYLLRFTFKSSLAIRQYQDDTTALFNHDSEGWHIKFPSLNLMSDEPLTMYRPQHSSETGQIEILKLRF